MLGSGPNRIGQGIEFDYCCVHAAQAFRRLGYEAVLAELEPGDGLDRLRHLRPALPRAGDARARARRRASSSGRSASSSRSAGRRRCGSPPALAAAGVPLLGDPLDAIDAAEDRGRFGAAAGGARAARAALGHGRDDGRGARRSRSGSATRCSCGRTTCSAAAGCASRGGRRSCELDGPALVDRFLARRARARRRRALRRRRTPGSRRSSSTSSAPACTRATRRASCPAPSVVARRSRPRSASCVDRLARGLGARGLLNLQLAVHEGELLRARGEPARVAHGSVRREGDRRPARRPRLPAAARRAARRARPAGAGRADARVGEGGDLPVRALRGRGRPRRRDALDRRGDGGRRGTSSRPTGVRSAPPAAPGLRARFGPCSSALPFLNRLSGAACFP